jgi:hypothetical protein
VRPNQSTQGGGCWIYDGTTPFHLEVPYYACYENMPFDTTLDLRDVTFASGVSMQTVEPLQRYRLRFADRGSSPSISTSTPPCRRGRPPTATSNR